MTTETITAPTITEKELKALANVAGKKDGCFSLTSIHANEKDLITTNGDVMFRVIKSEAIGNFGDEDLIDARQALMIAKHNHKIQGTVSDTWSELIKKGVTPSATENKRFPDYRKIIDGPCKEAKESELTKLYNVKSLIQLLTSFKQMGVTSIELTNIEGIAPMVISTHEKQLDVKAEGIIMPVTLITE